MFCKNCGKEIEAGSGFCENCGAAVNSQPAPPPVVESPGTPTDVPPEKPAGNVQTNGQQGSFLVGLISVVIFAGIILFMANLLGFISFGNGKEIEAAEKKAISFVTENYGEIPTVHGEVLKKVDRHVLVVVKFEVEVSGTQFDGSYLMDVSGANHIVWKWSDELPVDYDYESHLDEVLALWGI